MSKTVRMVLVVSVVVFVLGGIAAFVVLRNSASLDGTSWRLTEWSVSSMSPAGFMINATFDDGKIRGNSGVNSYGGPYKATLGGTFSAGPINSTLIAGPEDAMRAEQIFGELLDTAARYERDDTKLTLSDENGNPLLVFEPM